MRRERNYTNILAKWIVRLTGITALSLVIVFGAWVAFLLFLFSK